jgi:eukaryotic-like serine/threonine-protein kinase
MNHSVYAVDTATGRLRWSFRTRSDVQSTPAVADGIAYFGSEDHCVCALDAVISQVHALARHVMVRQ